MIPIARPQIGEEEKMAVLEVMESGMLAAGRKVREFEEAFASLIGMEYAVATSSGTTALMALMNCLGLRPGDRILVPDFTFVATANSVLSAGAEPVFCDIEADSFNMCPDEARKALQADPAIRGILLVHLYGLPCAMDEFLDLAEEYGVLLLEDAAQAHGALYRGRAVGSFGQASIFSFYPTKNITTGEGGMVLTKDPDLAEKVRLHINHGAPRRYHHEVLGYNYRMTDIAAAIGLEQLKKLPDFNGKRQENASIYQEELKGIPGLTLPRIDVDCEHVFHQYTIRTRERDDLAAYLQAEKIGTGIHYPIPLHQQPLFRERTNENQSFPQSQKASKEVLSLPVHPALSEEELAYVVDMVKKYYQ